MISVGELFQMTSEKKTKAQLDTLDISSEPFNPADSPQDREIHGDYDIPTLEEIAFQSNSIDSLLSTDLPLPEELKEADEKMARTGLSHEQMAQITEQIRKQVLKEVAANIQAYMNKTVARTVATANRDLRNQIQKQIEAALPELIDQAIARSKDEI